MTFKIDSIHDVLVLIKWLTVNYLVVKEVKISFVEIID